MVVEIRPPKPLQHSLCQFTDDRVTDSSTSHHPTPSTYVVRQGGRHNRVSTNLESRKRDFAGVTITGKVLPRPTDGFCLGRRPGVITEVEGVRVGVTPTSHPTKKNKGWTRGETTGGASGPRHTPPGTVRPSSPTTPCPTHPDQRRQGPGDVG